MARYKFGFAGGVVKHSQERVVSKFLLFHLLPNLKTGRVEEQIFFTSLRSGFITNTSTHHKKESGLFTMENMPYRTDIPNFKLFSLVEGFGVQKQFYSFYLTLDIHEGTTTILPLYSQQQDHCFIARFRFMSSKEIEEALGSESVSFLFYKKQLPLAKNLMDRIVIRGEGVEVGVNPASAYSVRKIRF